MKRTISLFFLLISCSKGDANPADAKSNVVTGALAVDIRQQVTITLTPKSDTTFDGAFAFGDGDFEFFDAQTTLNATVTREEVAEAQTSFYVATFSLPARASSRCGSQSITLALSLVRRQSNARVGGGLTAYCGANASGTPARVLRLTGDLPLP